MRYQTEPYPYNKAPELMTDGALKKAFAVIMESMERRIAYISDYLFDETGVRIEPTSSNERINQLPFLIASVGELSELTDEEQDARFVGTSPENRRILQSVMSSRTLDGQTLGMVFDAALLWGEAFRVRYPSAQWALGKKPRSLIDYGEPVLIGIDEFRQQFGVRRHLLSSVFLLLDKGCSVNWTVSEMMELRAFDLGLGPDPRLEQ